MSTSTTGTNEFYKTCGRCGTMCRCGQVCENCGEINRWDGVRVVADGTYAITWPALTEERVREIAREEIAKVLKGSVVSCSGEEAKVVRDKGLVCPWTKKPCLDVGRMGTRAGGGLYCAREFRGEKRCDEAAISSDGEEKKK